MPKSRLNIEVDEIKSSPKVHKITLNPIAGPCSICRCGHSLSYPFCDGSHKGNPEIGLEPSDYGPALIHMQMEKLPNQ